MKSRFRLAILLPVLLAIGCDELPTTPEVPDRFRVALITATTGDAWYIYEIDEEGETRVLQESSEPLRGATYTSLRGTDGAIAFQNSDGEIVVRHLESGGETVVGSFPPPAFSIDGTILSYAAEPDTGNTEGYLQVFVLDRGRNELSQVTQNECASAGADQVAMPCSRSAHSPVFGEQNEIYLVRTLVDESGAEELVVAELSSRLLERHFFAVPADSFALTPRAYFQNTIVVDYAKKADGTVTERGYYAVPVSGGFVDNVTGASHSSFCHDASLAVVDGTTLRFLKVATAEEIGSLQLPPSLGTTVLEARCSVQPRKKPAS